MGRVQVIRTYLMQVRASCIEVPFLLFLTCVCSSYMTYLSLYLRASVLGDKGNAHIAAPLC